MKELQHLTGEAPTSAGNADLLGEDCFQEQQHCNAGSQDVHFEQLDISDSASVSAFAQRIGNKYDRVAVLINNAGRPPICIKTAP